MNKIARWAKIKVDDKPAKILPWDYISPAFEKQTEQKRRDELHNFIPELTYGSKVFIIYPDGEKAMVREDTITLVVETFCYAVGRFPCERCRRQCTLAQMQGICSSCYYDKFEAHDLGPYSFD
ncbi:hypothetical protein FOZ61_007415 [Perkinsus olseni]|uniref:Uncharacterized protein n=1 Tax=Perkinsus olseni TaxID=32597 RepID=A0A7J6MPQ4_PEROL|nr:hypothetical protein FOZ61_007415 [Perkinsus olseni]KAF4673579.1 hypothetical protein FOL46_006927 [Perkinsus olseni]